MPNVQNLKTYLKMSDLQKDQTLKIVNSGVIKDVAFTDQKTKETKTTKVLQFIVDINGEEKELTLNRLSIKNLEDSLGPDTEKWQGQVCIVEMVKTERFGKLENVPVLSLTAWDEEKTS